MNLLAEQIKSTALEMGYEKCGIIKISQLNGYEEKLKERVESIPESKGFYQSLHRFNKIQDTHSWAKSIVICVRRYGKYHIPGHLKGRIAKYYLVDGRRDENSKELQDSLKFEKYMEHLGLKVENERKFGLTPLRWAAFKAGLGIIRKNNFFYTENGSWLTLEAWLINEELEAIEESKVKACSESCTQCIKACPSASLSQAYTMNPLACVSCITTFTGRDMPNEKYREEIGDWIYGCDACQDACPMNKNRWQGVEEFPNLQELSRHISLEKILRMDYKFLEEVMQPKFWYIDKADIWKWKVNAINAMVNNFKDQYKEHIIYACNDSNFKVREMAEWAIDKLNLK